MPMLIFRKEYKGVKFVVKSSGYRQIVKITGCDTVEFIDTKVGAINWALKKIDEMKKGGK